MKIYVQPRIDIAHAKYKVMKGGKEVKLTKENIDEAVDNAMVEFHPIEIVLLKKLTAEQEKNLDESLTKEGMTLLRDKDGNVEYYD